MELRDKKGLTEREFLELYAKKSYPRPYLTADVVLFSEDLSAVLLVRRGGHPFLGFWALPGGFARQDETVEQSAARELREETGVQNPALTPVGLFSAPGRDPRGWVVSQAYTARAATRDLRVCAGDDAAQAAWFRITQEAEGISLTDGACTLHVQDLAFDHGQILLRALQLQRGL